MPYLTLSDKNGEFDRRELLEGQTVVIGRAVDCDISVRDIMLSRKHCRIGPFDDGRWIISDLGSKNGTRVGDETITRHILSDGELIRVGKIQMTFHAGAFVPPPAGARRSREREARPTDPHEALAGTVVGFQLFDMEEDSRASGGFPIPKPKPADPASLRNGGAHAMVSQITSTAWDNHLSEAKLEGKPSVKPPKEIAKRAQSIERARETPAVAPKKSPVMTLTAPAPAPPPVVRGEDPNRPATIPRWLAWSYLFIAFAVGIACLAVIIQRSLG
jgi:predicted component of type VI protein secretion system